MRRPWLGVLGFALACTPLSRAELDVDRGHEPNVPTAVAAGPPAAADPGQTWRWDEYDEPDPQRGKVVPLGKTTVRLERTGQRLDLIATDGSGRQSWASPVSARHETAVIAGYRDQIIVAQHSPIATGCTLSAFAANDGTPIWTTPLHGVGPVDHSKYRNRVQLEIVGTQALVHGWESAGRYTEVVDLATGRTLANHPVDETLATVPWRWHGPDEFRFARRPIDLSTADGAFRFEETETVDGSATLSRMADGPGSPAWTVELRGESGCGTAAMARLEPGLALVRYCAASSGATLSMIDPATGAVHYERPLRSLGPVAHSEYFNTVELEVAHGHLVVYGREAYGRYIEVVDPATGTSRVSRAFWD